MSYEGTSRRALVTGALAGAAVMGFGVSRESAAARPAAGGITVTLLSSPDGCDSMGTITGVNRSGQAVGTGVISGRTVGPLLWSDGRLSAPAGPGGVQPLEVVGISEPGQYAGTYYDDDAGRRAALLWTDGIPQPIRIGFLHTRAALMDASGRVLVQARSTQPGIEGWTYERMFLYERGRATPVLPPDDGPWDDIRPVALNNRGAVVATVVRPDKPYERLPFFWQAGRATWLTDVGGGGMEVWPMALNDRGQVAGMVTSNAATGFVRRAFRWQAGTSELSPLLPGTTSGGMWVEGMQAINMRGDVVGAAYGESGSGLPVLWSGDTLTVLPVPDDSVLASALAVNDLGDVCGFYEPKSIGYFRPGLWRGGRRIDLPMPDGRIAAEAMRIDNRGVIYSLAGASTAGVTGGSAVSGGSTGGSTSGGSSTGGSTGGGSSTGGSSSGSSTSGGAVSTGGSSVGGATGGPGCMGAMYCCVRWTVSNAATG